jgi:hypothetical protein
MVTLYVLCGQTDKAWPLFYLATLHIDVNIASGVHSAALLWGKSNYLTMLPHVCGTTDFAVTFRAGMVVSSLFVPHGLCCRNTELNASKIVNVYACDITISCTNFSFVFTMASYLRSSNSAIQ